MVISCAFRLQHVGRPGGKGRHKVFSFKKRLSVCSRLFKIWQKRMIHEKRTHQRPFFVYRERSSAVGCGLGHMSGRSKPLPYNVSDVRWANEANKPILAYGGDGEIYFFVLSFRPADRKKVPKKAPLLAVAQGTPVGIWNSHSVISWNIEKKKEMLVQFSKWSNCATVSFGFKDFNGSKMI